MKKQNLQKPIYQAALYLRLSNQNLKEKADESDSIANQEALLTAFVNDHPDIEIKYIFKDDGWSGVNFDRPGFQKMMQKVYDGRVNCILVKDLSRLGRNHTETGRYISKIFPALQVRFVAVTDQIDSLDSHYDNNSLIIPFKDLLNDSYSKDISMKVRTAKSARRKAGYLDVSIAPYGYLIVGTKKERRYVVDDEAASVIRKIYAWTFDGMGAKEIIRRLNLMHILPPREHYREITGKKVINTNAKWSVEMIKKIIRDETYTGILRINKTRTPNYKVKKVMKVPEEEQIIRENDHDAIISQEEFDLMQDMLSRDMRVCARKNNFASVYPLSGYIYCGDCGGTMCSSKIYRKGKLYEYYVCGEHKKNIKICSRHTVRKEKVENVVLKAINLQLHILFDADDLLDGRSMELLIQPELDKIQDQIDWIMADKAKISKDAGELLHDLQEGLLIREEYEELREEFSQEIAELDEKANVLIREKDSKIKKEISKMFWVRQYRDNDGIVELGRKQVVTFIDRVEIFDAQHIKIHFRFGDEFKKFLKENKAGDPEEVIIHG